MYEIIKKSATEIAMVPANLPAPGGASINAMAFFDVPETAVYLASVRGWYAYFDGKNYSLLCMPTEEDVIAAMTDGRLNADLRAKGVEEAREWAREQLSDVSDAQLKRVMRQLAEHLEIELKIAHHD